jgi:hypothetical protein
MYKSRRGPRHAIQLNPKNLIYGRSWRSPRAPPSAHCRLVRRSPRDARCRRPQRSFHHAVSMMSDDVPLRNWRGAVCTTNDHHSAKSPSPVGGLAVDRIHDGTSNQIVLEEKHPVKMCAIVSIKVYLSCHLNVSSILQTELSSLFSFNKQEA